MKSKYLLILSVLLLSFMVTPSHAVWFIYHKPEFKGKVIDMETKKPIEGVNIVIAYSKQTIHPVEKYTSIINVKETVTDKNGEFVIPSYTTLIQPLSFEWLVDFIIYKPGYGSNFSKAKSNIAGIDLDNLEIFFSKETGSTCEFVILVGKGNGLEPEKRKFTCGIVELPKITSWEERRLAMPSPFGEPDDWENQKELIKAIRQEYQYLYKVPAKDLYSVKKIQK